MLKLPEVEALAASLRQLLERIAADE